VKHQKLTQYLIDQEVLNNKLLIKAFDQIDRRDFLPDSQKHRYLENRPIPIGFEQTNSQPFTVAFMLELLLPEPGEKILDVGSGSGWTAALIGATRAKVTSVELIPELVDLARKNLSKYDLKNVDIVSAGSMLGYTQRAPYDKILVSAGTESVPAALLDQLAEKGRMVIPVGQSIHVVEKTNAGLKTHKFDGFIFVPLIES
jgi:protein-L-isoaspartate(D-aspartate) O-methyltransferase